MNAFLSFFHVLTHYVCGAIFKFFQLSFNLKLELIQLHFQLKRLVRFQLTQQCV